MVRGQRRQTTESLRGAAAPDTMMIEAAQLKLEGNPEKPGGGSISTDGVLADSTHIARLKPAPKGVARLTNEEFWGRRSDKMINKTAGGEMTESPTNGAGNGCGTDGVREDNTCDPPTTRGYGPGTPGGGQGPRQTEGRGGGDRIGTSRPERVDPQQLGG